MSEGARLSEPRFWGSWKGQVVKAIAVENARTWHEIRDVTGLSERAVNTAISELYDAGLLERIDGRYRMPYDLYQEYRSYVNLDRDERERFTDRTPQTAPPQLQLMCPYCDHSLQITISDAVSYEVQCEREPCRRKWHDGTYKVDVIILSQHRRRGLGRNRPTIYYLRPYNQLRLISFESFNKPLMMNNGDLIALSYRRTSKGLLSKRWTGEYAPYPSIFQNISINHHWKL